MSGDPEGQPAVVRRHPRCGTSSATRCARGSSDWRSGTRGRLRPCTVVSPSREATRRRLRRRRGCAGIRRRRGSGCCASPTTRRSSSGCTLRRARDGRRPRTRSFRSWRRSSIAACGRYRKGGRRRRRRRKVRARVPRQGRSPDRGAWRGAGGRRTRRGTPRVRAAVPRGSPTDAAGAAGRPRRRRDACGRHRERRVARCARIAYADTS